MLANHLCSLAHGLVYGTTTAVKGWQYSLHQNRPDSILHSWEDSDSIAVCAQQMSTIDTWGDSANVELSSLTCNSSGRFQMLGNFVTWSGSYHFIVMTQSVYNEWWAHTPSYVAPWTTHNLALPSSLGISTSSFTGYSWRWGRPGNETIVM